MICSCSTPFKAGVGRHFDPRSPRGERPPGPTRAPCGSIFLSTLPARGATATTPLTEGVTPISIHAPREGSDGPRLTTCASSSLYFYPRSPRGERPAKTPIGSTCCGNFYPRSPRGERRGAAYGPAFYDLFLSTLPARGATPPPMRTWRPPSNFYPRSPRGERHVPALLLIQVGDISIHAPREGSDLSEREQGIIQELFLSTLPVRGATCRPGPRLQRQPDFYPRSP